VAAGETDDAIIDELLGSFSGAVLLDPPAAGSTLVLWLAPAIALMLGVVVIVWWRKHPTEHRPSPRPRARRIVPIALLAVAFGTIVVVAGSFLQDRAGPASGVAAIDTENLDDVSNETMKAVIAANAGHPEVDGMRLALAQRYFDANDYRLAFPHYLAVAQSPDATDTQAVTALVRLGWMAWDGNAEVETALELFDEALAIDEGSVTARYLKAQVLWCGAGDLDEAETLMQDILIDPDLPVDSREQVRREIEAIRAGTACK
jgi:tetratricopeptide (TPR) repeat protein